MKANIEKLTIDNNNYRKVLYTTPKMQLVLMSIPPNVNIGMEKHHGTQFFRFEKGTGIVILGNSAKRVKDGDFVMIPPGMMHDVKATGKDPLKLYSIYSPPEHKDGLIQKNKP